MADKKISQLGTLSAPTGADIVPINNSGETKSVSLTTLFGKIPTDLGYSGIIKHNGTPQTIGASGAVDLTSEITYVDNQSGGVLALTLANGVHGQLKTLVCIGAVSNSTVTPTNAGFTSFTFTAVNQTVTLRYLTNKWYIISSYGTTIN